MSERIIIDIQDGITPHVAVSYVRQVMQLGKVSESRGVPQYCFLTNFRSAPIQVITRPNRKGQESSSFIVREYTPGGTNDVFSDEPSDVPSS